MIKMTLVYKGIKPEQISNLPFASLETKSEYEALRLEKKDCLMILYTSGKLVVKAKDENSIRNMLSKVGINNPEEKYKKEKEVPIASFDDKAHIGSDETLKGDTFGGLVVSAFDYTPDIKDKLEAMGIKDSKLLSNDKISMIAKNLLEYYSERIVVLELSPKEYNQRTKQQNVTFLLDDIHKDLAKKFGGNKFHVVDKYPGCSVGDEAVTKGEECSLAIAAASIVARYVGLEQLNRLSKVAGFELPRGSTHVSEALDKLLKENKDFSEFCKLHFANVKEKLSKAL